MRFQLPTLLLASTGQAALEDWLQRWSPGATPLWKTPSRRMT